MRFDLAKRQAWDMIELGCTVEGFAEFFDLPKRPSTDRCVLITLQFFGISATWFDGRLSHPVATNSGHFAVGSTLE